jgi:RNA polymerase sigma-70 factor (ECF subfamily)
VTLSSLLQREGVATPDALLAKYRAFVWRLAYRFLQDAEEARDVTQEVLWRLHRHAGRLAADTRLPAWLTRVTANAALNAGRQRAARRRHQEAAAREAPAAAAPGPAGVVGRGLRQAVASLPRGQRAVVVLRLLEERTFREIADTLGVAEGTVKVQFARALRRLREEMGERT